MGRGMAFFVAFGVGFLDMNWALNYGWKQRGRAILYGLVPLVFLTKAYLSGVSKETKNPMEQQTNWNSTLDGPFDGHRPRLASDACGSSTATCHAMRLSGKTSG